MKINRGFIIGVVAFLVLVFVVELRMPTRFIWKPSYLHDDRQPFGCYVTDSLLSASLPGGYSVTDKTLYQLSQEKGTARRSFLILCDEFEPSMVEFNSMLRLLERGNDILLVAEALRGEYNDSILGLDIVTQSYFYNFKRAAKSLHGEKDIIVWRKGDSRYSPRKFFYDQVLTSGDVALHDSLVVADKLAEQILPNNFENYESYIENMDDPWNVECEVVTKDSSVYRLPFAVAVRYGRGKLICCSAPLYFTNYGLLETGNQDFVFRLLSQLDGRPVVRTESVLHSSAELLRGTSPLTFFLRNQPLRWAIYTALAGILLYFVFTARRRQRVIPVVKAPANRSLEFVRLIGTLYHQRHDNTDLVRKKFIYFSETLRREVMVDIGNEAEDEANAGHIAAHSGLDRKAVLTAIRELRAAVAFEGNMPDGQMRHCIDIMNKIVLRL